MFNLNEILWYMHQAKDNLSVFIFMWKNASGNFPFLRSDKKPSFTAKYYDNANFDRR